MVNQIHFTEQKNETYSQISLLDDDNGNLYFKVWTKDGRKIKYGCTEVPFDGTDSRVDLNDPENILSSVTLSWLITDISDPMGNYIRFYYDNDNSTNQYWIRKIEYTGNDNANLTPYNTISFYYNTAPYDNWGYLHGYRCSQKFVIK